MLLEEAGGVVTDPRGAPLDAPLDTTTPVAWVGYANPELAARIGPILAELVDDLPTSVARPDASTCSAASPTTRARACSRWRRTSPRRWSPTPSDALVVGPVRLTVDEIAALATLPYPEMRDALASFPKWTHYVLGVALVLVRHGVIEPPRARLSVDVRRADLGRRLVERRARGRDRTGARRRPDRAAPARGAVPGSGEPGGRVRPAGSWTRSWSTWVDPARCCRSSAGRRRSTHWWRCPPSIEVVGVPTGAEHDVERCALPASTRRRVHGQADRGGRDRRAAARG